MPLSKDSISFIALSLSTVKMISPDSIVSPFLLEPFDQGAFLHGPSQAGHDDFNGHRESILMKTLRKRTDNKLILAPGAVLGDGAYSSIRSRMACEMVSG